VIWEKTSMTRKRSLDLDCPKCEAKQSVTVYDSINVSLEPGLREKLLNGEINFFQCEKCGERAFIQLPLLYHDMKRSFMVEFYPFHALQDQEFLSQFTKDGEIAVMEEFPDDLKGRIRRVQIVFDMGELIRYVIFRERVHEVWKNAS